MQAYYNDAMVEEASYQTGGIGADRPGGGVALNMIPREGGNRFSGGLTANYRPGEWQGDNLTDRLKSMGVTQGNSTEYISDFTISQGGPIKQDKLWFFTTASQYNTNNRIANTFTDDGNQGVDENYTKHALMRLTWQISPRNKLGAYYDRTAKYRSNDMQSLVDPETASVVWTFPNYGMGQVKYTSTVSSQGPRSRRASRSTRPSATRSPRTGIRSRATPRSGSRAPRAPRRRPARARWRPRRNSGSGRPRTSRWRRCRT